MHTEFSEPCPVPPVCLESASVEASIEATEVADASAQVVSVQPVQSDPVLSAAHVTVAPLIAPLVAPEIGDSPPFHGETVSVQPIISPPLAPASTDKAVMARFWVIVFAAAVMLLLALSDRHAKDGSPLPFPNTSRIPHN